MSETAAPHLDRKLGLWQTSSLNMINMVGIGPFVVIPVVMGIMQGQNVLLPWIVGAVIAVLDSLIWAELGSKYPHAGGSYNFLRMSYSAHGLGRFMSFLLIWQTMIQAPLVIASGAIGFSQYLTYLIPLSSIAQKSVSGLVVIALTFLLYRKIDEVGKISVTLWIGVIGTMLWLILGGVTHFNSTLYHQSTSMPPTFSILFFGALGHASVQTIYCYLGYYNVCQVGGEVKSPEKIIPKSIFISVIVIGAIYLLLNVCVLGVVPVDEAVKSNFIVSKFVEIIYGSTAAKTVTLLILWIAFASLFSVMLGYSRVLFAAAKDGNFFKIFASIHPEKHFPHISLLALGAVAFLFSLLFKLKEVIIAIMAMRILVQFVGQSIGLILLHLNEPKSAFPFRMKLFPLPVIASIIFWMLVFFSTGTSFILSGLASIALGITVFVIREKVLGNRAAKIP